MYTSGKEETRFSHLNISLLTLVDSSDPHGCLVFLGCLLKESNNRGEVLVGETLVWVVIVKAFLLVN
jgi:hypothetical protein